MKVRSSEFGVRSSSSRRTVSDQLRTPHSQLRTPPWPGVIERYRSHLPVSPQTPVITLLEGNTPLILSRTLSRRLGRGAEV